MALHGADNCWITHFRVYPLRYSSGMKRCIWVRLIILNASAAILLGGVQLLGGTQEVGTISGVVTMDALPPVSVLEVTTDQEVCGEAVQDESIIADDGGHVGNAVVRVTGLPWPTEVNAPSIDNVQCRFEPHVQIARTGSQLLVTSQDDTLHSTHSYDDRNRTDFNIAMPFSGLEVNRPLRRPGVVRIECDSHSWMRGWVVVSNDFGIVTGLDGTFTIERVPAGVHELTVWHERLSAQPQTITVVAGEVTEVTFNLVQS